jgi:ATP-dependent DNA helicase RecG
MALAGARNRTKYRARFITPLIEAGWLAMAIPDKPRSSKRRYLTTEDGLRVLHSEEG